MASEIDPIAEELFNQAGDLFADGKAEYDEAYGIGKHPDAVLREVMQQDATAYGYRLRLKFHLKGETGEYTGNLNLPFTAEPNGDEGKHDWALKQNEKKMDVLNRMLAACGYEKTVTRNIDTAEDYQAICNIFSAAVGHGCPLNITADGKNVKGADGKWTFEPNGFSRLDGLRPKKAKK